MERRRSPMDLRDGLEREILEPYEPPRMLVRQANVDQLGNYSDPTGMEALQRTNSLGAKQQRVVAGGGGGGGGAWLTRLGSTKGRRDLRHSLSKRIARLSSLESNRSSSSMELETDQQARHAHKHRMMPLISITSNDNAASLVEDLGQETDTSETFQQQQQQQRRRGRHQERLYGGSSTLRRSRRDIITRGGYRDEEEEEEEDDDDDAFEDASLPMPYSSHLTGRSMRAHFGAHYPATLSQFEELLDDRQGMNNSEQQFTKAEQAQRVSLDGSIISDVKKSRRGRGRGQAGGGGGGGGGGGAGRGGSHKSRDKRRSKSPSASSLANRRRGHSRRGFLGLASRLKLTKKHESIAKLQLYILNSGIISLKVLDRDLQSFLPRDRLSVREFQERVGLMRKYDVLSNIEYRFVSKYETYVCKHAQQETNQPKNNYKKCIPYDYNRVVLKTLPQVPDSDYINASHVDSCLKPNAYIAAQGPNENTIEDFWRMIWEQKTFVIVMLTKVFDFIRVMCNQYWPVELNKPERYGCIEVTLLYEEPLADFVIRTIKITKLKSSQQQAAGPSDDKQQQQQKKTTSGDSYENDETNPRQDQQKQLQQEQSNEQRASLSDDEYTDDTDISEELPVLNELHSDSNLNLAVRAPKFIATRVRRRRDEDNDEGLVRPTPPIRLRLPAREDKPPAGVSSLSERATSAPRELAGAHFVDDEGGAPSGGRFLASNLKLKTAVAAAAAATTTNEFLHPLFNAAQPTASLNSLASEPNSPVTPRTPSSAGLDRSSATRRAVKKKRRERIKNQRPKRTQFMVPSESQLLDDDEDIEAPLTGATDHGPPVEDETGNRQANGHSANERIIYQFHYNSWASHTCPFISSLLHFRRRVRICMDEMSKSGRTGPTVVHCNDGCGRTGTYLCIDANLELAEEDNVLDIYAYTRKMRQSRKFLIENLEQYKFVYDTIEEATYCGKTWFPVADLHKRLKHKSQRNPLTRKNEYLLEYEKICRMTSKFSIGDCAGGHRVENREKNRDVSTVPPDNFRPYLTSFQTNDSTDYINAVFVDGYTRSKEYIVTEWPQHRTISDFWSLVYDHDCNSVILLANPGESSTYPSFLPSEKELRRRFGPVFSAEMVSYTHYQNIKSWIYTINKKIVSLTEVIAGVKSETKTTQVFQITCWPQGHRVPTSTNALVELMNMVERWRQRTTYGPVCVVSLNGKSRAGVYCAANVAIEQVVQHSEVDVFNAVKTVRRHRPQLIENMTEYKYCYDLILHYVLHYVNRANES